MRKLDEDLFKHRLKKNTNQLENTMLIRNTRRDIARVNTVLAERCARRRRRRPAAPAAATGRSASRPSKTKRAGQEAEDASREAGDLDVPGHKIHKRRMVGVVTSDKMNKTRVVLVERRVWRTTSTAST